MKTHEIILGLIIILIVIIFSGNAIDVTTKNEMKLYELRERIIVLETRMEIYHGEMKK